MNRSEAFEKYFGDCLNCGDCCHLPGDLLPEQIDILANHFKLDRKQLFEKYLIIQIFAPNEGVPPAFLVSPVKADRNGNRVPKKMVDQEYMNIRHLDCIFRDHVSKGCSVHEIKPFACDFLVCAKATRANPVVLDKTFFYHHWLNSVEVVFSVYPELQALYEQLKETALRLSQLESEKAQAIEDRNRISGLMLQTIMGSNTNSLSKK